MTNGPVEARAERRSARWARVGRVLRRTLYVKLGLLCIVAVVASVGLLRLAAGPVSLAGYVGDVGAALAARIGPGWSVKFRDAALELKGFRPDVRASDLEIRNPGGVLVVRAPLAVVGLDPLTLLTGRVVVRAVDLQDLQLRMLVARDGSLSFVPQEAGDADAAEEAAATDPGAPDGPGSPSTLSRAVASLIEPIVSSDGVVGALDRASVSNARLTLVGADGRERVGFSRVGAEFVKLDAGRRSIDLRLEGPHGSWRLGGTAQDDGHSERGVDLVATDVPVADVLLLGGLSGLPEGSDLKFSAQLRARLTAGRLSLLDGGFTSSSGVVEVPNKDLPFLHVDQVAGSARWDETARKLSLTDLAWRNGRTNIALAAELSKGEGPHNWKIAFSGKDAVLDGADAADVPVQIDTVAGKIGINDNGLTIRSLSLLGPDLDLAMTGSFDVSAGHTLRAGLKVRHSRARHLLRLWPEAINADLRRYLGAHLLDGVVDDLTASTTLDDANLKLAFSNKPVSDEAMDLSFSMSQAKLVPADGLPPVARLTVSGTASGNRSDIAATGGRVELPDGRTLNATDISYRQADFASPESTARIAFRLEGPADALASMLRAPLFREANTLDLDPGIVKGRADLRVYLPLQYSHIPKAGQLPLSVNGSLTDFGLDKVAGREKLDGANLTLAYDLSGLFIRGEGRVSGSPASIDLHQPRGSAGEVVATVMLDDAARQKRSLPNAPQLVGALPVKITAALGGSPKPPVRIEADLGRATINDLLPGWSKPAGRPGRVSFAVGDDTTQLRDFVLDAGPIQMRGTVSLAPDGGIDHADLSTVKVSPGDDIRAQVDRSGGVMHVALRGNVADARPLIKSLTAPPAAGQKSRDGDLDLDLALNILTGNNDEAMTGVTAKVSTRKGDIRQLQFDGRFRGAAVEAELVRRETGVPFLQVRSGDAGATLRFLDVYKRMVGGRLGFNATLGTGTQTGNIAVDDFALKNEPALRRIIAQGPPPSASDDRAVMTQQRLDGDEVVFSKLKADFQRNQARTDYRNVVIYGPAIGFTLSGFVDNARDRTDIAGTFVPAYGLNNVFSQLPIVGPILGGDRNEGLFAVDFRISGAATSPTLSVNPLSAVAPGILRKFFGWALPDADFATGATTPTRPPSRPER